MKLILNNSFSGDSILSVVSSPAALGTLPAVNLFNGMRHKLCRIVPVGNTATITTTLISSTLISAVGIGLFNLTVSATCQCIVRDAGSSIVYDSGVVNVFTNDNQINMPSYNRTRFWFTNAPVAAKSIEITINDAISPFDISHLVFGNDISPSYNPDWGVSWNWVDTSIQQRTQGGSLLANPAFGHRRIQMTWPILPDSDWNNLSLFLQSQGKSLMLSVMPGDNSRREIDLQMIGRVVSTDGINLANFNVNSLASVIIEEI